VKSSFPPMHRGRCLLFSLLTLLLCSLLPTGPARVLAAPAAPAGMVRLRGGTPAVLVSRAHPLGRVPASQAVTLALTLPLRDPDGLDAFLSRRYDPTDPLYQHPITTEEFASRFGPTQQSYDAVAAFARAHGLVVTYNSPSRLLMSVSGPAAAVESAFAVHLSRFQSFEGRVFHAPDTDPAIPASLVGRLSGVVGLDNSVRAHSYLRRSALSPALKPLFNSALVPRTLKPFVGSGSPDLGIGTDPYSGLNSLTPSDIKAAYNLSTTKLTGAGQTLGLYELDGYEPADVVAYEAAFGLGPVPLQNVLVGQSDGRIQDFNGQAEVTLDIEAMAALAPRAAKILVYEGKNGTDDQLTLFQRMADDNLAKQISVSWGYHEVGRGVDYRAAEDAALKEMAAHNQSIYAASGDAGAYDDFATISVDDPASQPFMVAVGGTTLSVTGPGGGYRTESPWGTAAPIPPPTASNPLPADGGGGGGISVLEALPDYQKGVGLSSEFRNVPDVSLNADPSTGYAFYIGGRWFGGFGGTSVAAPLWAAFTALANQQRALNGLAAPLGFPNMTIYPALKSAKYASAFNDVNDNRTNFYYHATTGYDNATGWGSFNGAGLLPLFAPPPSTVGKFLASLTVTPGTVVGGLTVTGTVTLVSPAPAGGAVVTLTSTDATVVPVSPNVTVAAGQTSATFPINTNATKGTTVTITAAYQGDTQTAQLVVQAAPVTIAPASLTLDPPSVNGGTPSAGTVTLTGPAPKGGLVVSLSSSDPAALVPATVTVPEASTSATFTVTTIAVPQQVAATITASANGTSVTATLTVLAPALEKVVFAPASVPGGQSSTAPLTLTLPAPAGGGVVTLSSDNPVVVVPATVVIPAGGTAATFTATTKGVPSTVTARVKITFSGLSQFAPLEVRAARLSGISVAPSSLTGGAPAVGTVTLDSPVAVAAGLAVALSSSDPAASLPASVSVPQGATTATFPLTTAVVPAPVSDTLTASLDGFNKTALLSVQPIQVINLTLAPAAVIAGVGSVGTVTVNAPAPPAGLLVTLSQTGAAETLPASVTVPAGASSVTFPIGTPVSGTVTVAAVVGGQTRTATLTVTTAVGTSFPAGLNMLSVPYDYAGQPLDALFGYAGVRMATWDGSLAQYAITPTAPADSLRLGRSYFVNLPKAVTLTSVGTPADPTADFSIALLPGWNMIGDPFLVPASLSATHVATAAGAVPFSAAVSGTPLLVSSLLYSYSSSASGGKGGYTTLPQSGSLQPGAGYWIYAYTASSLVIPHPGQ